MEQQDLKPKPVLSPRSQPDSLSHQQFYIKQLWHSSRSDPDTIMLWAACTTAFFGFCRIGEISVLSLTTFDPTTHLTPQDIAIDNRTDPSLIGIHLKVSKTDQERKGITIFIGKMGYTICPIAALTAYLAIRGQSMRPLRTVHH